MQASLQESLAQVTGLSKDEQSSQLTRILEVTGLDKLGLTPNLSGVTSNIGGIASNMGKVLGLGHLLFEPPLAAGDREINFELLDGVSLGRSLTALSPYASLLLSIVAPYATGFVSLIYTLVRAISLTIGFQ